VIPPIEDLAMVGKGISCGTGIGRPVAVKAAAGDDSDMLLGSFTSSMLLFGSVNLTRKKQMVKMVYLQFQLYSYKKLYDFRYKVWAQAVAKQ